MASACSLPLARHRVRAFSFVSEQSNALLGVELDDSKDGPHMILEDDFFDIIPVTRGLVRTITAHFLPIFNHTLDFFTPTITIRYLCGPPRRLRSTAYLDGLRGVAALIVAIHHFSLRFFPSLERGYGSSENDVYFFQLPILRVIVAGRFMVAVFFCISGYVLSINALKFAHGRQDGRLLQSLASSFFIRWGRIVLPCLVSIFISSWFIWLRLGGFNLPADWRSPFPNADRSNIGNDPNENRPNFPLRKETFGAQAWDASREMWIIFNPWRSGAYYSTAYNSVLCTIQAELQGSFVVYALSLTLAFVRPSWKFAILAMLGVQVSLTRNCEYVLFLAGTALAEANILHEPLWSPLVPATSYLQPNLSVSRRSFLAHLQRFWTIAAITFSLYAGSHASNFSASPGFKTLAWLVPRVWGGDRDMFDFFWPSVSAVLLVASVSHSARLKRLFELPLFQWLGELSFALYLVHLLVLNVVAAKVIPWCIRAMGRLVGPGRGGLMGETEREGLQREEVLLGFGLGLGCCVSLTVLFWASDLFTRDVNERAARWAKTAEEWMRIEEDGKYS